MMMMKMMNYTHRDKFNFVSDEMQASAATTSTVSLGSAGFFRCWRVLVDLARSGRVSTISS